MRGARELKILDLLNIDPFLFPAELVEQSDGILSLSSIYTDLRRLKRDGLVVSTRHHGTRRRFYNLTEAGIDVAMCVFPTHPSEGRIDAGEMVCAGPDGKARSAVPRYPEVRMAARPWADHGDEDDRLSREWVALERRLGLDPPFTLPRGFVSQGERIYTSARRDAETPRRPPPPPSSLPPVRYRRDEGAIDEWRELALVALGVFCAWVGMYLWGAP